MFESDWVKKRLMNTKESTLEWIGTFFFIAGYLFIILLYNAFFSLESAILAIGVLIILIIFGFYYSIIFFGVLGSFIRPENPTSIYDGINSSKFLSRHSKIKWIIEKLLFAGVMYSLISASIYIILYIYDALLFTAQIKDVVIAILIAILIEHFFQLLGIGFKNIIQYQELSENIQEVEAYNIV